MVMPMNRTARFLLWFAVATVAAGIIPAVLTATFNQVSLMRFWQMAWPGIVFSTIIGSLAWAVLPRIGSYTAQWRPITRWMLIVAALLIIAVVGCFVADLILLAARLFPAEDFAREFSQSVRICILITLAFGICTFIYESLRGRLQATTLELRTRELAEERALKMAAEARLSSLESRVQPHFLFNTLNSISSLIREDPVRAERMVERLAALLRFSLDNNQAPLVPLRQELKIIADYLEIEKARFGNRLRYSIDIPPELVEIEVPPMSLQTVVENSVKYAVSPSREGAEIRIRARALTDRVAIEISDDGPGFDRTGFKSGHGLDNLESRLGAIFGNDASLEIIKTPDRTAVRLLIPQRVSA
jgi:signal transduction histidine kinase